MTRHIRFCITGAQGQLGWALTRCLQPLGEVVALSREQCDLSRPETLPVLINALEPDVIINAAAYTNVELAETEESLATTVNATAVGVLADIARRRGAWFIHYSTDYVFDGKKASAYTEDDVPHPLNVYGHTKLAGEQAVQQVGGQFLILRTSWLYAARGHNFLNTMLRLAQQGAGEQDILRVVNDQTGTPTWAEDLAQASARLIQQRLNIPKENHPSLLNVSNKGSTTWYAYARFIVSYGEQKGWWPHGRLDRLTAISSADYAQKARRPANSTLDTTRLALSSGLVMPTWSQSVARCLASREGTLAALGAVPLQHQKPRP